MWNTLTLCLFLVLVVLLVTALAVWWMPPTEPPLRKGMSLDEVHQQLGEPVMPIRVRNMEPEEYWDSEQYWKEPDCGSSD